MKKFLLVMFIAMSTMGGWAMYQQEPPQVPPAVVEPPESGNGDGHTQPTEYCTPSNMPDGKMPCMCLHNEPNGCKEGHRDTEMRNCNSWCFKAMCHCCSS